MSKLVAFVLIALATATPAAHARVHSVFPFQTLEWPLGGEAPNFLAAAVAIDGDSIIVLTDTQQSDETLPRTRVALLYRRRTDGSWAYSRILTQVTAPQTELRAELAMKNNLAVIKIHRDIATIWERTGGNWVQATVANGLREPGSFAISTSRILAGSSGCTDDGLIYEKSAANGHWVITGRIPPDAGVCADQPRTVELNYDYAFIRSSPALVRSYRRNGSALPWVANRTINLPGQASPFPGPVAVQLGTAVAPGSAYFTRSTNWIYSGQLMPIDYPSGTGDARSVLFRDSVLLATESWDAQGSQFVPYVYVQNSAGGFDHVGILQGVGRFNLDFDISGRTIVAASGTDHNGPGPDDVWLQGFVTVYVLPATLVTQPAIANNFDARDISGLTLTAGNGFALAGNSSNYILRQSVAARDTAALFTNSNWQGFQFIGADVTPRSWDLPESWNGIAVRYVDENNYYFAGKRNATTFVLGRKVNGVVTTLAEEEVSDLPAVSIQRLELSVNGTQLIASLSAGDVGAYLQAEDSSLSQGRAALVTHRARADYDNVYVAPTASTRLLAKQFPTNAVGRQLTYLSGDWRMSFNPGDYGLNQLDPGTNSFAIAPGPAIDNQSVTTDAILNSFGSTNPVASFGLVTRWTNAQNHYSLSVRSSNSLQIRKMVNGTLTVLKGITWNVTPGSTHRYTFEVRGNELTASVDGIVRLRAIDNSLPRGQYGIAAYRTTARFLSLDARQP